MFISALLITVYSLIALFALAMTYEEQQKNTQTRSLMLKSLGYLACLLWPITFVAVAVAARTA